MPIKIPNSKEAIKDYIFAGLLIAAGVLSTDNPLTDGFDTHLSGLAIGIGVGWLIKSIFAHRAINQPKES